MHRFRVDDVEIETDPLATTTLADLYVTSLHVGGDPSRRVISCRTHDPRLDFLDGVHPLIGAVSLAFSCHRPLVLGPDAVWLTIAQGVAQHIRDNAETLRARLVRHRESEVIDIETRWMPSTAEDWSVVIDALRDRLADAIGEGRARLFECNFSTSTTADLVASQIVLLDAYSPYFHYELTCICGIPSITLTGTPEDWRDIRHRLDLLDELGLREWCSRLRPIIDEMIATSNGKPNVALWKRIYNPRDAYGGDHVTGWITRFYPHVTHGSRRVANPLLRFEMDEPKNITGLLEKLAQKVGLMTDRSQYAQPLDAFPNALSRVPVRCIDKRDLDAVKMWPLALHAGLVAIAVGDDGALEPISGWHVNEATVTIGDLAVILREHHAKAPLVSEDRPARHQFPFIPAELDELWARVGLPTLFEEPGRWRFRHPNSLVHIDAGEPPPARGGDFRWRGIGVADLPDGKTLCHLSTPWCDQQWFVCTLDRSGETARVVEPLGEVIGYGNSLAKVLATAIAKGGDLRELASGASLAMMIATRSRS